MNACNGLDDQEISTKETEAKFRIGSAQEVKDAIASLGAQFVKVSAQLDRYMQHPCRDLISSDEALRLRMEGIRYELTYKGSKEPSSLMKKRPEKSCQISDFESMEKILMALGFRKLADIIKQRTMYRFKDYEICVDIVENLGQFIEIEWTRKEEPDTKVMSEMISLAQSVGAIGPPILKSYLQMYLEKTR
jgi:adenylate cyclase class 2